MSTLYDDVIIEYKGSYLNVPKVCDQLRGNAGSVQKGNLFHEDKNAQER